MASIESGLNFSEPGFLGFSLQDAILGLLGGAFGGFPGAALGLGSGRLFGDVARQNLRAEDITGNFIELSDVASEAADDVPRFESDFPGLTRGAEGEPDRVDFTDIFTTGQAGQRFIEDNLPSFESLRIDEVGPARDAARGAFSDLLGSLDFTPRTTEDLLQGVDLLPTDLSEVLGARLSGIGAAGQARETPRLLDAAREAQRSGLGLEGARRLSSQVGFEEQATRGLEAAGAVGQTRIEEQIAAAENARLQAGAASQAEQINQGLRGLQANIAANQAISEFNFGQLGLGEAGQNVGTQLGLFGTQLQGALGPSQDVQQAGLAGVGFEEGQQGLALQIAALQNAIAQVFGGTLGPQMQQTIVNPVPFLDFAQQSFFGGQDDGGGFDFGQFNLLNPENNPAFGGDFF
jgi:hypothetical protein